ncbi:MAG: hypothetical protein DDT26_00024 [Dehalococcoidia bacterium]|nr:hypothetical protein [Chloroflexota bacterium]
MPFKLTLSAAAHAALPEAQQPLYTKDEATGQFRLDLDPEDIPDVTGLKKKNQELLDEKKAEQRRREDAERERAKKDGDIAALETSWQTRLQAETGALKTAHDHLAAQLEALTVGRAAVELATELAVVTNGVSSSKALLPHIERRLRMEAAPDGTPKVRVLDAAGKLSALTLEQLKEEFRADPVFAPLIQASKASGGGADGHKNSGGGGASKKFAELSESERVELYRRDPAEFRRQSGSATPR